MAIMLVLIITFMITLVRRRNNQFFMGLDPQIKRRGEQLRVRMNRRNRRRKITNRFRGRKPLLRHHRRLIRQFVDNSRLQFPHLRGPPRLLVNGFRRLRPTVRGIKGLVIMGHHTTNGRRPTSTMNFRRVTGRPRRVKTRVTIRLVRTVRRRRRHTALRPLLRRIFNLKRLITIGNFCRLL